MITDILLYNNAVVVIYEDNTYCSKVYNGVNKKNCANKAKSTFEELLDLKETAELTLDRLCSKDKTKYSKLYKFNITEARYQDKRLVEKIIRDNNGEHSYLPVSSGKKRKEELLIPIRTGVKEVYWVRESRIYKQKWIDKFESKEALEEYVENYKLNKTKFVV